MKDALERHKKSKERKKQDILSVEKRNLHSSNQQLEQVSKRVSIFFFRSHKLKFFVIKKISIN